jgi:putative tryptophan/tyrosine transport system substrate-binding protein
MIGRGTGLASPPPYRPGMDRRRFLLTSLAGALAAPLAAGAQPTARVHRVGLLWSGASPPSASRMEWFREGLRESGYVEGQNLVVDVRYSEAAARLRTLAAEFVGAHVSVIATFGDLGPKAAQQATAVVPIVALADDFVGAGLAPSLARPSGNITGVTIFSPELSAKRLSLLKEVLPRVSRVAVFWDPATDTQLKATQEAARSLNVTLQVLEVRSQNDLTGAFQAATRERPEALNVFASPLLSTMQQAIVDFAATKKFPAIYQWKEHAQGGGLMSYGPSLADMWRQTARVVGKILKGAKPADLPIEQPTKFELAINLKTAKALGLTIPPSLLARADQVIE